MHLLYHHALHQLFLLGKDREVELVVHLQYHLAADALAAETVVDAYHGHLDDVGLGALYGGVDGVSLGESPHGGVLAVDVRQVAAAVVEGLGVSPLAGALLGLLHELVHLGEGGEVAVYQ